MVNKAPGLVDGPPPLPFPRPITQFQILPVEEFQEPPQLQVLSPIEGARASGCPEAPNRGGKNILGELEPEDPSIEVGPRLANGQCASIQPVNLRRHRNHA